MPRYNIFIDLTQIFVFMVLRCQCLFQCFIIFLKTIRLFICLFSPSLSSLGNHFLHFFIFQDVLISYNREQADWEQFSNRKRCNREQQPSPCINTMYVLGGQIKCHRCICTSHFHSHIHLALVSSTEAYFILCRTWLGFINKTGDQSLTAQI